MQADGENQEPVIGTITWTVPTTHRRRSGTGVLIGPDIVCTAAHVLYDPATKQSITNGSFDLGRGRVVAVVACYLPSRYISFEDDRDLLSRFHNFAFIKLAEQIPGARRLAVADGLTRLTPESWLTLYGPARPMDGTGGRTRLQVTAQALTYAREEMAERGPDACPQLLCRTDVDADPTGLPVLFAGELVGLAVDRPRAIRRRDNSTIFGVDIVLCTPYLRRERQNAETAFEIPRTAGQLPHPMLHHLRQRVGAAHRGERPPVRVRGATPEGLRYVEVSADTFDTVLAAAGAIPWTDGADRGWDRLKRLTQPPPTPHACPPDCRKCWHPFPVSEAWIAGWLGMHDLAHEPKALREEFATAVTAAGEALTRWVEPEVLELIGWPRIQVHREDSPELEGDDRAHYTSGTQTIHIKASALSCEQLLHEFGHHLEEQGPVEVWCGLASYLMAEAEGRPLAPPGQGSREPAYGWITDGNRAAFGQNPPLPHVPYALSYYPDGGTELIAVGLEFLLPDEPHRWVQWPGHDAGYQPQYMWHLLRAIRPRLCLEKGIAVPTLLGTVRS